MTRDRSRRYGDATLTFQVHPVRRGITFMHFTHSMNHARVEEHPLGGGRLTRVDMGHNPQIADIF